MGALSARQFLRSPSAAFLIAFCWLLVAGAILVCAVAKIGNPPDGSAFFYYGIRPPASVAPIFGVVWALVILLPKWRQVSVAQKLLLFFAFATAVAISAWVFHTVRGFPA